jgi:hypothetical protein
MAASFSPRICRPWPRRRSGVGAATRCSSTGCQMHGAASGAACSRGRMVVAGGTGAAFAIVMRGVLA